MIVYTKLIKDCLKHLGTNAVFNDKTIRVLITPSDSAYEIGSSESIEDTANITVLASDTKMPTKGEYFEIGQKRYVVTSTPTMDHVQQIYQCQCIAHDQD